MAELLLCFWLTAMSDCNLVPIARTENIRDCQAQRKYLMSLPAHTNPGRSFIPVRHVVIVCRQSVRKET